MNRLYYSNNALMRLKFARDDKMTLLQLDRDISRLQTELFMKNLHGEKGYNISFLEGKKNGYERIRKDKIDQIAEQIYSAIIDAISAIKISVYNCDRTSIMLDDNVILNITYFITEYYKDNEIENAVKDKFSYSRILSEISQIQNSCSIGYLAGINRLKTVIGFY